MYIIVGLEKENEEKNEELFRHLRRCNYDFGTFDDSNAAMEIPSTIGEANVQNDVSAEPIVQSRDKKTFLDNLQPMSRFMTNGPIYLDQSSTGGQPLPGQFGFMQNSYNMSWLDGQSDFSERSTPTTDMLQTDELQNRPKGMKCQFCPSESSGTFNSVTDKKRHVMTHLNLRLWKCVICERKFSTKYQNKTHFASCHKNIDIVPFENQKLTEDQNNTFELFMSSCFPQEASSGEDNI